MTNQSVLILRHAKSSWKNPNVSDHDKPLNIQGDAIFLEGPSFVKHSSYIFEEMATNERRRRFDTRLLE